ncbi:hypothetical protein PVAP13_3KG480401 [Panicum virgatum]|uniref:Uncharacterized protein n=1 Tax=Panicum virgatum TaxID=38727 RepID=A0A8T0VER4_PANVG|nr:hypothetical protein PVAP13_3KG480401 [Panicum virgatum]
MILINGVPASNLQWVFSVSLRPRSDVTSWQQNNAAVLLLCAHSLQISAGHPMRARGSISAARVLPRLPPRLRQPPRPSLALPSQTPRTAAARASRPPLPPSRSPRDPNPYAGMNPVMIAVYISIPPPPISRPPRVPRGCTQQTITYTTKQVAISRARKGRARGRRAEPRRRAPRNRRAPPRSSIGWESSDRR